MHFTNCLPNCELFFFFFFYLNNPPVPGQLSCFFVLFIVFQTSRFAYRHASGRGFTLSHILNGLLGWDGTISRHMPISNCFVVVQVVELQIYDGIFEHVNVKRFCTYGFHFKGLGLIWETPFFYPTETLQLVISYQLSPQNIRLRCADGISSFDILFSWCLRFFFGRSQQFVM